MNKPVCQFSIPQYAKINSPEFFNFLASVVVLNFCCKLILVRLGLGHIPRKSLGDWHSVPYQLAVCVLIVL